MDIFGIIYKALNKLNKLVTGLRKDVDNKQAKLTHADGSEVTDYKDLKLNMLKGLPFRDTVLIVNTNENGFGAVVTPETSSQEEIIAHTQDYTIYIKDPVKYFYNDGIESDFYKYISACLSLKTSETLVDHFSHFNKLTYCGYIDTMDSSEVSLNSSFNSCKSLNYIPDYFIQVPITGMIETFYDCESLTKLPMLNTSSCDNFSNCCTGCGMYGIPNWDFSAALNMDHFAMSASNLISVDLNLPEATNIDYGFSDCKKLTTCNITAPKAIDISAMFKHCLALTSCTIKAENANYIAGLLYKTESLTEVELSFTVANSCYELLAYSGIKTVRLNLGNNVDLGGCFKHCCDLETITITGSFRNLSEAFYGCKKLKELHSLNCSTDSSNPTSIAGAFNGTALVEFPILIGYVTFDYSIVQNDFVQTIPKYNTVCYNSFSNYGIRFETPNLITVGGFTDLSYGHVYFEDCPLLSRDSVLNIFDNLHRWGDSASGKMIVLHSDVYNKLSEEDIAIAVNKRWVVEKSANSV